MARAVIFCMGCKRHMHRAKKLCKEVQKDSANAKEMQSRENKGEKRDLSDLHKMFARYHDKIHKNKFLVEFLCCRIGFWHGNCIYFGKDAAPEKRCRKLFWANCSEGYSDTHSC